MTTRKLAGLVTALAMIAALVPLIAIPAFAEGQGSPAECETGIQAPGNDDLRSYTAPEGQIVDGVCIRSGANMFDDGHSDVLGNGTYESCYEVSGVGTGTVTVARVGTPSPNCQELSHVDVLVSGQSTTTTEASTTTTEASTTTTTEESTTTTTEESTTTTTEESTTTTTEESTTTTEEETTTTTEGEEEETTTTTETEVEGETTSTTETEVEEETTSTAETDDDTEETLPFTGIGTDGIALVALLALLAGAGLIFLTRGSAESDLEG